jgi:LacI family transcriptional regulator
MAATLKQIALKSGVSAQTVSRILRDQSAKHRPETRRRVLKIARELNYRPNPLSRALLGQKSMTIGLIVKGLSVPVATRRIRELAHIARKNGYLIYIVGIDERGDDSQGVAKAAREMLDRRVDGLVIYRTMPLSAAVRRFLESQSVPTVFMGWGPPRSPRRVIFDRAPAIEQAAAHLLNLGHRRAALFGAADPDFAELKLTPYQRIFARTGMELLIDPRWTPDIADGVDIEARTYHAVQEFLAAGADATALVMNNDEGAIAALAALRHAGLDVPGDMSVIGFDNSPGAPFAAVPLTTIGGGPADEVAAAAFGMLKTLIDDPAAAVRRAVFPFELIVRRSTGPCPGGEHPPGRTHQEASHALIF